VFRLVQLWAFEIRNRFQYHIRDYICSLVARIPRTRQTASEICYTLYDVDPPRRSESRFHEMARRRRFLSCEQLYFNATWIGTPFETSRYKVSRIEGTQLKAKKKRKSERNHVQNAIDTISVEWAAEGVLNYKLSKTYRISEKGNKANIETRKKIC